MISAYRRAEFDVFADAVADRLEHGAQAYRDRSFERPSVELVGEVLEELEDVAGWAFLLWTRLQRMRAAMALAEKER
jgi:hypothetical protein